MTQSSFVKRLRKVGRFDALALGSAFWLASLAVVPHGFAQIAVTAKPSDEGDATVQELRRKAEQGDPDAQFRLGRAYRYGMGIRLDKTTAAVWFRKAAESGHPEAQDNLGSCYWSGEGVPQDQSQAVAWWRKSADGGYGPAQSALAGVYLLGIGVPKDPVESLKWFILSSAMSSFELDAEAAKKHVSSLTQSLPLPQVEEAQKRAREWMAAFEQRKKK